jgi:hypothetical protein
MLLHLFTGWCMGRLCCGSCRRRWQRQRLWLGSSRATARVAVVVDGDRQPTNRAGAVFGRADAQAAAHFRFKRFSRARFFDARSMRARAHAHD